MALIPNSSSRSRAFVVPHGDSPVRLPVHRGALAAPLGGGTPAPHGPARRRGPLLLPDDVPLPFGGDKTQIDLARRSDSGLLEVEEILKGIDGIEFIYLTDVDVVRHRLVKDIIKAYATHTDEGGE